VRRVRGRPPDASRDPVQFRDETAVCGERSLPQRIDERTAAPAAHGLPCVALLHVRVAYRAGELAQAHADVVQ